jgi:hypothetical protein
MNWSRTSSHQGRPTVADDLWVQRTSPSTVVVRRGFRIVLSLIDDGEVERIGRELLAIAAEEANRG